MVHHSLEHNDFVIDFNRNYESILYRICQKSPIPTPPAFGAPVGVNPFEFYRDIQRENTRVLCYHVALFA